MRTEYFASGGKDGPDTFQKYFLKTFGLCRPIDVYGPSQGDKLLEEKAQRRIINR